MSEETKLYKLWCEWDIGHEYIVFKTEETALLWADNALHSSGIEGSLDELLDEGLIGVEEVVLVGGKVVGRALSDLAEADVEDGLV